ncbi:MAG: hypothetical protein U5K51_06220 [Flavobacteriaceae bacterium]|nr:hypothetical protein [Flavobacteriaceae bacterium]
MKTGAFHFTLDKNGTYDDRFILVITDSKNSYEQEVDVNTQGRILVKEGTDSFEFISKTGNDIISVKICDILGRTILEKK